MIRTVIAALAVLILASMPDAFPDDLAGRASIIDADTLEIHWTRIRLWASTRLSPINFAGPKAMNITAAARKPRTILIHSFCVAPWMR
jgi:hypothetical protein